MNEHAEVIEVNEHGGLGSRVPRFDLIDARALYAIAEVCRAGAEKYSESNWRACDTREHLRHAIAHAYGALEAGQQGGREMPLKELSHLACRAMMALAVALQDEGVAASVIPGLAVTPPPAADNPAGGNEWVSYANAGEVPTPGWLNPKWGAGIAPRVSA